MLPLALAAGLLLAMPGQARVGPDGPAVTIVAVGDVQLGRGVGRAIAERGSDYPFAKVSQLLSSADLTLANLECAISDSGIPIQKKFSFKASPQATDGLKRAGVDIAILANNHSLDCGRDALADTLAALRSRGITPVGAGPNAEAADAPAIAVCDGLRIAVLARTFILPEGVIYREDAPTVSVYDPDRMRQDIQSARRQADVVIVSLHWGIEYAHQPQESQVRIAHELIDAGADLVIGHHTHTPQPVERYQHGLIAYSLGNFVFDSAREGGRNGLVLQITLTRRGVESSAALPVQITDAQPRPLLDN